MFGSAGLAPRSASESRDQVRAEVASSCRGDYHAMKLFGVLPQHAYSIRVGITQTAARFNLREPKEVVTLLEALTKPTP